MIKDYTQPPGGKFKYQSKIWRVTSLTSRNFPGTWLLHRGLKARKILRLSREWLD